MYGSLLSFKEHQVKHLTHKKILFSGEFNAAEIVSISMIFFFFFSRKKTIRSSIPPLFQLNCAQRAQSVTPTQGEHLLEPVGASPEQAVEGWSFRGEKDYSKRVVLKDLPEAKKKTKINHPNQQTTNNHLKASR